MKMVAARFLSKSFSNGGVVVEEFFCFWQRLWQGESSLWLGHRFSCCVCCESLPKVLIYTIIEWPTTTTTTTTTTTWNNLKQYSWFWMSSTSRSMTWLWLRFCHPRGFFGEGQFIWSHKTVRTESRHQQYLIHVLRICLTNSSSAPNFQQA